MGRSDIWSSGRAGLAGNELEKIGAQRTVAHSVQIRCKYRLPSLAREPRQLNMVLAGTN